MRIFLILVPLSLSLCLLQALAETLPMPRIDFNRQILHDTVHSQPNPFVVNPTPSPTFVYQARFKRHYREALSKLTSHLADKDWLSTKMQVTPCGQVVSVRSNYEDDEALAAYYVLDDSARIIGYALVEGIQLFWQEDQSLVTRITRLPAVAADTKSFVRQAPVSGRLLLHRIEVDGYIEQYSLYGASRESHIITDIILDAFYPRSCEAQLAPIIEADQLQVLTEYYAYFELVRYPDWIKQLSSQTSDEAQQSNQQ